MWQIICLICISFVSNAEYLVISPNYISSNELPLRILNFDTPSTLQIEVYEALETYCWQVDSEERTRDSLINAGCMDRRPIGTETSATTVGWNDLNFDLTSSEFESLFVVVIDGEKEYIRTVSVGTPSADRGLLLQSDKSLYKPGETVKFRVIPLQRDLRTFDAEISMRLTSPDGMLLAEWENLPASDGFVKAEFPIDDSLGDSFLGEWTIEANSGDYSTSRTFTLEEYVLQKFSVSVDKPSYVLSTQRQIEVSVRGEYTYGEGVQGVARLQYRSASESECWGYQWYYPGMTWESRVCGFYPTTKSSCTCNFNHDDSGFPSYWGEYYGTSQPLIELTAELENGEATFQIDSSTVHNFGNRDVCVRVFIEEESTGETLEEVTSVLVDDNPYKVLFEESTCTPGFDYSTTVTFTDPGGLQVSPPAGEPEIRVFWENESSGWHYNYDGADPPEETNIRTEIDSAFISQTKLDDTGGRILLTVENAGIPFDAFKLHVEVNYGEDRSSQQRLEVPCLYAKNAETGQIAQARIQAISDSTSARVDDTISFSYGATSDVGEVYYMIVSGQSADSWNAEPTTIVDSGVFAEATSTVDIVVSVDHVPALRFVVFGSEGTLLAHQVTVEVSPRYADTSATFSYTSDDEDGDSVIPGSQVDINMQASAGSTMLVGIVDSSILLMSTPNDITESYIMSQGFIPEVGHQYCQWQLDANQAIKDGGLNLLASDFANAARDYYPVVWFENSFDLEDGTVAIAEGGADRNTPSMEDAAAEQEQQVQTRKNFPESWLWVEVPMDADTATLASIAPDTITEWTMTAISVHSESELGISSASTLTTFKPFFVQISSPYDVIRNEVFYLNLTAFNYESADMEILITLELPSELSPASTSALATLGFTEDSNGNLVSTWLVEAKQSLTKNLLVRASEVGDFPITLTGIPPGYLGDSVIRTLSVVPEGLEEIKTNNVAVSGDNVGMDWQSMDLIWPDNRVEGSENMLVSFTGDLMGSTIANLDRLIRQPWGCGEQNIVSMAPQTYVYKYLEATDQLSGEQKKSIIANLHKGYTRELRYMHSGIDLGGYSAYGDSDPTPSTFLTAFVLSVFLDVKESEPSFGEKIVDPATLRLSIDWLLSKQSRDGRFPIVGRVLNTAMKGGISDTDGMTCYITGALSKAVEMGVITTSDQIDNAKEVVANIVNSYLNKEIPIGEIYSFSLCAYAHLKANADATDHSLVYNKLMSLAKTDVDTMWWTSEDDTADDDEPYCGWYCDRREDALALEMTAYNLMSMLETQPPIQARSVATWMTRQRNSNGGFYSSQDTCVGLKALASFGAAVSRETLDLDIEIKLEGGETTSLSVNEDNRQTYQLSVFDVDNVNPEARLRWRVTRGEGTAYLGLTQRYHYTPKPPTTDDRFVLETEFQKMSDACGALDISTSWASEGESGMVIVNAKAVTGCCFVESALADLKEANDLVRMYEHKCSEFTIYLDELTSDTMEVSVPQVMSFSVENTQPQPVYVQQYYNPGNMRAAVYNSTPIEVEEDNSAETESPTESPTDSPTQKPISSSPTVNPSPQPTDVPTYRPTYEDCLTLSRTEEQLTCLKNKIEVLSQRCDANQEYQNSCESMRDDIRSILRN